MKIEFELENPDYCDGCPCADYEFETCQLLPNHPILGRVEDGDVGDFKRLPECIKRYGK